MFKSLRANLLPVSVPAWWFFLLAVLSCRRGFSRTRERGASRRGRAIISVSWVTGWTSSSAPCRPRSHYPGRDLEDETEEAALILNPPNNLWILAAVLAPIAVVTLIIIIITAVLCRKNKNDFKADSIGNLNPRAKMMEQRLENAFSEAQAKQLGSHTKLSVQMLSVSQVSRSPAVSLVYSHLGGGRPRQRDAVVLGVVISAGLFNPTSRRMLTI
ncbi:LOW QUALITY PROTEIN: hypothetical protein CRUP_036439 [Coryphaenoides rupestris]|nr:LOW QUALITY PROTEIN: hypothetical protein CRUP_036439 [Coryphaenoides rupestris]